MTPLQRLLAKVAPGGDGCWVWTAGFHRDGYGQFKSGGRTVPAHRAAYELLVGEVPDGLVLDHLCRNRACVNPRHLEPVTNRENVLRGETFVAENLAKTHCPNGHPYSGENLAFTPDGRRRCRACARDLSRRQRQRPEVKARRAEYARRARAAARSVQIHEEAAR